MRCTINVSLTALPNSVSPATPATECLLRTSYMATLKEPLLDEAMDIMASVLTEEAR